MTIITIGNGSLLPFLRVLSENTTLSIYFGVYTVQSYISISCYMTLVKRFGGVSAVVLTTARKAMTLVLSFLLFPKGFSWLYVAGSLLVLGAVMIAGICKKLGVGAKQKGGEYSLAYTKDEECSRSIEVPSEDLLRESSAEAIFKHRKAQNMIESEHMLLIH